MTKSEIAAEIIRVEAQLESPEGKGKITSLKAYHRKLCTAYHKASA